MSFPRYPVQGIRTLDDVIKYINHLETALEKAHEINAITFTSSATPDAENAVTHSLGRVPSGFTTTSMNKAASVYMSATPPTATTIYLKVNVASTIVTGTVF